MRKIINKLFEWLGYKLLSKKEYDAMNLTLKDIVNAIIKDRINVIKHCTKYQIVEDTDGYMVICDTYAVKFFPYGDNKEYARLCAEELCEKLNERI